MSRIPNITSPLTSGTPLNISDIWFRFFEAISRKVSPTVSSAVGSQTINAANGKFEVAAAATSATITNSQVASDSIVICTIASNDATARVNNVVVSSGAFTVNLTAPTAQTSVAFAVMAGA